MWWRTKPHAASAQKTPVMNEGQPAYVEQRYAKKGAVAVVSAVEGE